MTSGAARRVPVGAGSLHPFGRFVDHGESYGRHVIDRFVRSLEPVGTVLDLGAGRGRDLAIVKRRHPAARTIAIEAEAGRAAGLGAVADEVRLLDIERANLPFPAGSIDLVIANQVLEHTKEVFWIFDQVTRVLRPGGSFVFGTPNVASLHNRVALLLFGRQPSQNKLCSAHVRPFSKGDTLLFLEECFPGGYELAGFAGAQFYPFPRRIARALTIILPTMAYSIFFHIRKVRDYHGDFLRYPDTARLETNFWTGDAGRTGRGGPPSDPLA